MSDFLDELRHEIDGCGVYECPGMENNLNQKSLDKCFAMIDSLGKNARRMFEIGILQDELVKLGFSSIKESSSLTYMINEDNGWTINFWLDCAQIGTSTKDKIYYNSPTWQQDVLTKIKEIINHD